MIVDELWECPTMRAIKIQRKYRADSCDHGLLKKQLNDDATSSCEVT